MTLYTVLLIVIVALLFYLKKKVTEVSEKIEKRVEGIKAVVTHPKETAAVIGEAVADTAITQAAKLVGPQKKKRR